MTRPFKGFLFLLPALIILIHDGFIFGFAEAFNFSTLDWLLQNYAPEAHLSLIRSAGEEYYGNFLKPLLDQKAFFVFGGIGLIGCLWQFCFSQIEQPYKAVDASAHQRALRHNRR